MKKYGKETSRRFDLWERKTVDEIFLLETDDANSDIDGDGKLEFGVNQQAVYFFDYELGEDACSISYCG